MDPAATTLQDAKRVVRTYQSAFDSAPIEQLAKTLEDHVDANYRWRGMHPFYEQVGATDVVETFWHPLRRSFTTLQRRQDIFFAGHNHIDDGRSVWVASMGHFMGLFDRNWLGIRKTGKLTMLRYAEFHRIADGRIAETALFVDVVSVMQQANCNPLPPQTGAHVLHPGPRTQDGLLYDAQPAADGKATLTVINGMIDDLSMLNKTRNNRCPPELLAKRWHDDMAWYGPAGIGSTYTIVRYQKQHQYPFRIQLKNKRFNGHVARFAEGNYGGFFGWANLTNTPRGGFLGLPGNEVAADMRVVDIYRRDGDKLAENWVFVDLLHWLSMQGLDVLERNRALTAT